MLRTTLTSGSPKPRADANEDEQSVAHGEQSAHGTDDCDQDERDGVSNGVLLVA